jgi:DNA-directed RNA polymerase subunit M/transcription elongation factor TFIIS
MDLLTNAVESIQTGVEDYEVGTRPRLLSAVRSIHSGILLLYKEALLRRSPENSNEALIKSKVLPRSDGAGGLTYVGIGRKTVDTQQIRERFDSLGIATDWKLFGRIANLRNEVEHYFPNLSKEAIAVLVASAFLIIRQFSRDELAEEPRTLLGQKTWDAILKVAGVYEAERNECNIALAAVDWNSGVLGSGVKGVRCTECGSDLLKPADGSTSYADTTLECQSCGALQEPDSYIPGAVAEALEVEAYVAATDGGEEPYVDCPECGLATYVIREQRCAHCGESQVHECSLCGNDIPSSELGSAPLCGWCDHMTSKHD